jgi:predicted ABC-type ATPase
MAKPVCTIIAGPNGAGKTTFALQYLDKTTRFINADLIASGLSPLSPELQQMKASRLFLKEIKESIHRKENFAFETTLSGKSYAKLVQQLQEDNWIVDLIYLYLPSVKISLERVAERVKHGGHNIPETSILRRYPRSLKNLIKLFSPLCDTTICLDNSDELQKLIFIQEKSDRTIKDKAIYQVLLASISHD